MTTTVITFATTPQAEEVLESKGSLARQLVLTKSLGFMCSVHRIHEVRYLRFIPLRRTRLLASFEADEQAARAAFAAMPPYRRLRPRRKASR